MTASARARFARDFEAFLYELRRRPWQQCPCMVASARYGRRAISTIFTIFPPDELHIHARHEDGSFWATVEEFPGVFATGDGLDELWKSLEEGISLMLERSDVEPDSVITMELKPA